MNRILLHPIYSEYLFPFVCLAWYCVVAFTFDFVHLRIGYCSFFHIFSRIRFLLNIFHTRIKDITLSPAISCSPYASMSLSVPLCFGFIICKTQLQRLDDWSICLSLCRSPFLSLTVRLSLNAPVNDEVDEEEEVGDEETERQKHITFLSMFLVLLHSNLFENANEPFDTISKHFSCVNRVKIEIIN